MPIRISEKIKNDPEKRWNLDDRTFFAAGACHILAYAFLQKFSDSAFYPLWIKPNNGIGNHIVVSDGKLVFDYRGYSVYKQFFDDNLKDWQTLYSDWGCTLVSLPSDVLISEAKSKEFEGLWLREPSQFLHDPLPRAYDFINLFNHEHHTEIR